MRRRRTSSVTASSGSAAPAGATARRRPRTARASPRARPARRRVVRARARCRRGRQARHVEQRPEGDRAAPSGAAPDRVGRRRRLRQVGEPGEHRLGRVPELDGVLPHAGLARPDGGMEGAQDPAALPLLAEHDLRHGHEVVLDTVRRVQLGVRAPHQAERVLVEPEPDVQAVLLDAVAFLGVAAARPLAPEPVAQRVDRHLVALPQLGRGRQLERRRQTGDTAAQDRHARRLAVHGAPSACRRGCAGPPSRAHRQRREPARAAGGRASSSPGLDRRDSPFGLRPREQAARAERLVDARRRVRSGGRPPAGRPPQRPGRRGTERPSRARSSR